LIDKAVSNVTKIKPPLERVDLHKTNRARLFKTSKPTLRQASLINQDGSYGVDMGNLWAAYKADSFPLIENRDMSPSEFGAYVIATCRGLSEAVIVEDDSTAYSSGRGPIAFIGIISDGWKHEPHVDYFAWRTSRNVLRTAVAFMLFMRYNRNVGVCVVRSLNEHVNLFKRVSKYTVLNYVGKIFKGTPRGDEHIFTVAGKKKA